MPISKIRLLDFKCFADSGEIPLAPLTVIFGRNNTGKSSILQSILLLRQTLDSPEYGPCLDLRGPLYQAGSYADIVHQHKVRQNVVMDFEFARGKTPVRIDLHFSSNEPQPARLVRLKVDPFVADPVEIKRGRGRGGPYEFLHFRRISGFRKGCFVPLSAKWVFPINWPGTAKGWPSERKTRTKP